MPFKPFKPPLIRRPPSAPQTQQDTSDSVSQPSAKRRRIGDHASDVATEEGVKPNGTVHVVKSGQALYRKPLILANNSSKLLDKTGRNDTASGDGGDGGVEGYYNVLWRKFTAKKHRTWDGDGILSLRGGYAYLQDVSGKDMGRIMFNSPLKPGSALSIGGKDVEVDSILSKEEYLAGRPFLGVNRESPDVLLKKPEPPRMTPISVSRIGSVRKPDATKPAVIGRRAEVREAEEAVKKVLNVAAPKSIATNSRFKNPLKEDSVLPSKPNKEVTPRHDPNQPGAIVMKRPESVPKGKQIVDVVVDPLLGKHLREHQREGVKLLYECVMGMRPFNGEGAILADEMGLGKTLQTIALLWTLMKQNPIYGASPVVKKALIVCPVTLIKNWQKEFRKWLGNDRLGVFVADGKHMRLTDFTMGMSYNVMIIGYERLRTVQEELAKGRGIDIVIADEGHRLKTVQNKSAQAIQSLNTARRIILSGTPIQNDLSEFFAMVDFVNPGLLGTFKMFMKEFEGPIVKSRQPGASKKDIEKGEARSEELAGLTSKFILRRTADILSKHLPPKTEYILFCNPTPAQANIYRHVIASPIFQSALGDSESALQLITILKKLCNSPSLLTLKVLKDENPNCTISSLISTLPPNLLRHFSPASSGKIRVLDQLLHNLHSTTSEKIVLVSNYTSTLNLLAALLSSLSLPYLRLDGSTPASKRQFLVDDFNRSSSKSCFAFLLSAKAGGIGLNLTGASRLVLFDVDWNPATDIQAMARIHRDGQKRHCHIYRMLLRGGLEEKIWQRQVTKLGLADSVMDQKNSVAHFSREELRDLFRLDEDAECQTHDLLGCECGGRGKHASIIADVGDNGDKLSDSESPTESDDSDEIPDPPSLIKASKLLSHPSAGERKNAANKRRRKMRSLMQYSHISTQLLVTKHRKSLEEQIGDDVLLSLLGEEGNGVRYLFKRDGFAGLSTNTDKMGI
ncbi:ISWI chromatin-remodeling complex ATPase ISW2 [Coccidioides immitis RMSCC 2394]|uniref:ISWI chromatin-remodeling complex ATPase ISW2 n=1 Tax=Coccidioides immitis RMSCC 2394 TaxID=404692 RepID=A0A0J6YJY5_COCIT|nr:ISWI chromatin-remodeling complex ATPase ISW2 [Coccidioides immitis RMSCC 2394]